MISVVRQAKSADIQAAAAPFAQLGRIPSRQTSPVGWLACALAAIGLCTLAAVAVALAAPHARPLLLQEDGIVEMASVMCLLGIVIGSAYASLAWGWNWPLLLAGLIGLAELLDETSFGSRLFGFEPPELHGGGQLDGFHDLLMLAYRLLRDINGGLAWLLVGLMLAASLGLMLVVANQLRSGFGRQRSWLAEHVLLFLHIGFIGLAQVIDITSSSSPALAAIEEVLEFNAALALVFYVAQQAHQSWQEAA
jgi:hypothetical protein